MRNLQMTNDKQLMTHNNLITIIPAKPFEEAKTRLAAVLSPQQRQAISRNLLMRTITLARQIGPVVVVSRSAKVRQTAHKQGAETLTEATVSGQQAFRLPPSAFRLQAEASLNAAIRQGLAYALSAEAESALILPLDLPLLSLADLRNLLELSRADAPALVIAPCRRNQGTNALLLRPPSLIAPQFGTNSFAAHQSAARGMGVTPKIYRSPGLMYDLDSPDDWQQLLGLGIRLPITNLSGNLEHS